MSRSLRYKNPVVRDHLASHYVLGLMTPRVRRRCEYLMQRDAEFEGAIYHWQINMTKLNSNTPPVDPPPRVWQNIDRALANEGGSKADAPLFRSLLESLAFWRSTAVGFAMAAVFAFVLPMFSADLQVGASYVAVLSSPESIDSPSSPLISKAEGELVISAYKGEKPGTSQLAIQWNDRLASSDFTAARIVAVSRTDGSEEEIGDVVKGVSSFILSKAAWAAIKDSAELRIVANDGSGRVLLSGPCIQLQSWG